MEKDTEILKEGYEALANFYWAWLRVKTAQSQEASRYAQVEFDRANAAATAHMKKVCGL